MTRFGYLIVGPDRHGVTILAHSLARSDPTAVVVAVDHPDRVGEHLLRSGCEDVEAWHVHFTDQLFGDRCDVAAANFERLVAQVEASASGPISISVTLHDLPMLDDDPARYERRAAAYRRVVAAVDGAVIVSSDHEARALRAFAPERRCLTIALPIDAPDRVGRAITPGSGVVDIVVLGFVFPGKGHHRAITAAAALTPPARVVALGAVADGHDDLAVRLGQQARSLGCGFLVTGFLDSERLMDRLAEPIVPLAVHERVSAAASIGTWLQAGRRPLVADHPFTRELDRRCPGAVTIYSSDQDLDRALRRAVAHPDSTWLEPDVRPGPSTVAVARCYQAAITASIS